MDEVLRLLEDYTLEELLEKSDTSIEEAIEILLEAGMINLEVITRPV
jgi:hypothetical protein